MKYLKLFDSHSNEIYWKITHDEYFDINNHRFTDDNEFSYYCSTGIDIPNKVLNKLYSIFPDSKYEYFIFYNNRLDLYITYGLDYYYYVMLSKLAYKCDSIDGLIKLLKDVY